MNRIKICDCGVEIAFMKTKNGKFIPVRTDTLSELEDNDLRNGFGERLFDFKKHKSHFVDCPNAQKHRRST